MKRIATSTLKTLIDIGALAGALVIAWLLRFDWIMGVHQWGKLGAVLPYVVGLQYLCLRTFVVHRFAWTLVGLRETTRIFQALATATAVLLALRLITPSLMPHFRPIQHVSMSIAIILIDFILAFCAIVGLRVLRRVAAEKAGKARNLQGAVRAAKRTLLIGAGQAGVMVAKEVEARPDLGIKPVGFVDDDPEKLRTIVHGVTVLGTTDEIVDICERTQAEQVLITIASASGSDIRRIVRLCEVAKLAVKIVPSLHEIVGGRIKLSQLRDVAIEDLLKREPVKLDTEEIASAIQDEVVVVTGAGGSIGSELCRQACGFKPSRLLLIERAENNLFEIHRELKESFPDVAIVPLLADVRDEPRIRAILAHHKPSMILHAAAHKHVPLMEENVGEAIKNNVFGTRTLAQLADLAKVDRFVMISTDKAVNPSSVMGATKRLSEIYLQALSQKSKTKFINVRFGNVLGSAGSVVPIFRRQIAAGGPVTVTHPEMKRYFMTIPEASQLVLQAATMGEGGEIFILDMGEPVKIVELARDLITLSGFRPDEDIEIRFSGTRPGEKLFEELSLDHEKADKTRHPKIFVGRLSVQPITELENQLARFEELVRGSAPSSELRAQLHVSVPEYREPKPEPDATSYRRPEATARRGVREKPVAIPQTAS